MEHVFSNARVVTLDADFFGSVCIKDGEIDAVDQGEGGHAASIDCEGDFLIPGLVDLHTDNLEKHYMPRPDVTWDSVGSAVAHDAQMAASGVTTVFDSLSVRGVAKGLDRRAHLKPMLDGVIEAQTNGLLRVDHKLHLRCEVSVPGLEEELSPHLDHPLLSLMSVMDHTPGQRQYRNVTEQSFIAMLEKYDRTEAEIEKAMAQFRLRAEGSHIADNRAFVAKAAQALDVSYASHDDETPEHILEAASESATIAEFPVTLEAAEFAKSKTMDVVMGAPNLLRGGSHSGNVAVADVAKAGAMDVLASDYLPLSMIRGAFLLTQEPFNWSVSKAIRTVTSGPAKAGRLNDRGRIEKGLRADLVRVRIAQNGWPQVRGVWVKGERVT